MNYNPRFEQLDIDDGSPAFDLVERIESEIPWTDGASGKEIYAASGVGRAFEGDMKKKLFGDLALWDQGRDGNECRTWEP